MVNCNSGIWIRRSDEARLVAVKLQLIFGLDKSGVVYLNKMRDHGRNYYRLRIQDIVIICNGV